MEPGGPEVLSEVSIHALLVECDRGRQSALFRVCGFNPRTPCGVRLIFQYGYKFSEWFQSTHSLWSATGHGLQWPEAVLVSIHALLVECDVIVPSFPEGRCSFNPRTPCGVRRSFSGLKCAGISGFNPRTPCGVRHFWWRFPGHHAWFQSTHSLWSATIGWLVKFSAQFVSIHALLVECDGGKPVPGHVVSDLFQSTHSLWSATIAHVSNIPFQFVSIHALLVECDPGVRPAKTRICSFNPRTPCGVRP